MTDRLTALLLPGLDGTGKLFERFVRRAPSHIDPRVVAYPDDTPLGYDALEQRVRQRLPAGPFIVVAESFSGPLGVRIAARPPANLIALVLTASFVTPPRWPGWKWLPWQLLFRFPAPAQAVRRLVSASDTALLRDMHAAIRQVSPAVLASRVRSVLSVDDRDRLREVKCPILYIGSRRDHVVPRRCLQHILAVRDDVAVESFDTLHLVLQQAPNEAWAAIDRFVRSRATE